MTSRHDIMTNNHFWAYTWKQNLFSMSQGSTLSIWHKTYDSMTLWHHDMKTWQHDKQSLLSLHMKTKVVQHVPGINIKHLTYDIMTAWQTINFEPTHENTRHMLHAQEVHTDLSRGPYLPVKRSIPTCQEVCTYMRSVRTSQEVHTDLSRGPYLQVKRSLQTCQEVLTYMSSGPYVPVKRSIHTSQEIHIYLSRGPYIPLKRSIHTLAPWHLSAETLFSISAGFI